MFNVGDKVVWVRGSSELPTDDYGALGVVTKTTEDGFCSVHFITGIDAGETLGPFHPNHLRSYEDFKNSQPVVKNTFASMADGFLDACGVLSPSSTTNEDDVLKQIQNYNRVVKVVEIPEKNTSPKNKYDREIVPGVWIDVYDLLAAWKVTNPALQHLIKKALQAGDRGHKDLETDLQDIIDSAMRAKQLEGF